MKCVECGTESAETTPRCVHCGAPVLGARQEHSAEPEPVQDSPPEPAGRPAGRDQAGRQLVGLVGVGLLILIAIIVIAGVNSQHRRTAAAKSQDQLTEPQLRPGDCLTGSNLGLGGSSAPWPETVTQVPCNDRHLAEVIFAGNDWPESLTKYPGDNAISDQGWARCEKAFKAYDGMALSGSQFYVDYIAPDSATWAFGDRLLVCVADSSGGPMKNSVKGSGR